MVDLATLVKGAAKSRTLYAVAGLLGINLADPSGLDIRLWINGHIFDLGNLSPIISIGLAALATWGRLNAAGPLVVDKSVRLSMCANPGAGTSSAGPEVGC